MPMRGLTIIVAEPNPDRFRTALTLAIAATALGNPAHLFLDGSAVTLLRHPIDNASDHLHHASGLPGLAELIDEALDAGVRITMCQTGLHLTAATPADYDDRVTQAGMVSILEALGNDRLVVV